MRLWLNEGFEDYTAEAVVAAGKKKKNSVFSIWGCFKTKTSQVMDISPDWENMFESFQQSHFYVLCLALFSVEKDRLIRCWMPNQIIILIFICIKRRPFVIMSQKWAFKKKKGNKKRESERLNPSKCTWRLFHNQSFGYFCFWYFLKKNNIIDVWQD